jgi:diguanylate cyclase (GGDEF)-like protein/PAS domain S-box-containing protein
MNEKSLTNNYMISIIVIGLFCVAVALFRFPVERIDFYLVLLFAFTIGIGSRISIQIPRFKSYIAVSDTFIFLALLLYGGEVAIVLASIEAFCSAWRVCKKKITVFFNAGVMGFCTTFVVAALHFSGYLTELQFRAEHQDWNTFIIALSIMALTQFASNTIIAAVYGGLKTDTPVFETWKTRYLWIFVTYVVGAATAGVLFHLTHYIGFGVVIVSFPIILLVYLSYKMYLKNVEMSISQAEQAEQHARVLELQSIALKESEARFRSAFDYAPIGIGLVSPNGRWIKVNHALNRILGYSEEEFLETDFQSMIVSEDLGETLVKIHELTSGKTETCQLEQRYLHKSGKTVWASWSVSPISNAGLQQPNLIFQIQDITDKKLAEEKLQYEATHDSLTDLPNRAYFMARLEKALEKTRTKPNHKVSVLFIDLDRFKNVNDSLGHIFGDQLLIEIAEHLKDCLRTSDLVARLGGDEFTILVEGNYEDAEIIKIAERIQHKFARPFNLSGHEVYSSASIGVLRSTADHLTAQDMMRDADTAMYQAKRAGKARHEVFDPGMHELAKQTLLLEMDLRRAVENEEITVFYQPIYSISDDEIEGFEALARWHHKTLGAVPPDKFIPLAEEIGLIDTLGGQILRKACLEMQSIQKTSVRASPLLLSVNLSCKQFAQPNLVHNIKKILDETNFPPQYLKLEITESVFFEHKDLAIRMLKNLRELDIEINIDDFGTGYSNLSYLTQLPISTLKIDRTFIDAIESKNHNMEIVQTIITLARSLGMKVIAEGVENEYQLEKLKSLKCEGAQGFYFAKPMSFEDMCEYVIKSTEELPLSFDELPVVQAIQ